VIVHGGGTLVLSAGTYYIEWLTFDSQSRLRIDQSQGPVAIYVENTITHRGIVELLGNSDRYPTVGVFGTGTSFAETPLPATLISPQGDVVIGGGTQIGVFFARRIEVRADTVIRYVR
jgi:hypothetical protein